MEPFARYRYTVVCAALGVEMSGVADTSSRAIELADEEVERFLPALRAESAAAPWSAVAYDTQGSAEKSQWEIIYERGPESETI